MDITAWCVLLGLGIVLYAAVGYQIAQLSYRVLGEMTVERHSYIDEPTSALLRVMLYPIRAHAMIRKCPDHMVEKRLIEDTNDCVYIFGAMLLWPLRIVWNICAIAVLYLLAHLVSLVVWIFCLTIADICGFFARLFARP